MRERERVKVQKVRGYREGEREREIVKVAFSKNKTSQDSF